ncbi:hypothetical protein KVR01_001738 [Diaporthe batatas]|uniref:uncharacterized protein n=1 Tax=Diaporthe batatas TaxID=748121 RepID=UPI001D041A53|nr:uncharacterized protein KVR01_001738 [Diaporthe batatas]KAG8168989.1 hypothetical protein KVR01_001738 [Diaporthe batatas]
MLDEETDTEPDSAAHSCSTPLPGNISGAGALPQFPSVSSCANLPTEVDGPSQLQGFPHSPTTPPIDGFGPASSTKHPRSPRADPRGTKRSRSCDLNREMRKFKKPEICVKCGRGFAWKRDLTRHYKVHHKTHALEMGVSVSRIRCAYPSCTRVNKTFSRKDHLTRHLQKIHKAVIHKGPV